MEPNAGQWKLTHFAFCSYEEKRKRGKKRNANQFIQVKKKNHQRESVTIHKKSTYSLNLKF